MKKVLVFIADGTEEVEVVTVVDYLRRAEIEVDLVSVMEGRKIKGAQEIYMGADKTVEEVKAADYDAFYVPGGLPGATNIRDNEMAINLLKEGFENNKIISALCAAPIVLEKAGVLENKNYTCYPSFEEKIQAGNFKEDNIVVDGNIITGRGPAIAASLAYKLIEVLVGKEKSDEVREGTLYNLI